MATYARGLRTQQRLLACTASLVEEHGAETTLRQITTCAGVTAAGALHHFQGRDDLVVRAAQLESAAEESTVTEAGLLRLQQEVLRIALDDSSSAALDARQFLQDLYLEDTSPSFIDALVGHAFGWSSLPAPCTENGEAPAPR